MPNHKREFEDVAVTRREFLNRCGMGFGGLGLTMMMSESGLLIPIEKAGAGTPLGVASHGRGTGFMGEEAASLAPKAAPLPAKAKHVIHIFTSGAPSHLDTFDYKPELAKHKGKQISGKRQPNQPMDPKAGLMASPFKFERHGKSGIPISQIFPHLSAHADEMCVINSMYTDIPAHDQAQLLMNCGTTRFVRPSMGSWATYGLGTENQSLPGFIAMSPGGMPLLGAQNWNAGFLPGIYQGTFIDSNQTNLEKLIENIKSGYASLPEQRQQLDLLHEINDSYKARVKQDSQLEARVQSFELAFQMQEEAAKAFDVTQEPESVLKLYGSGAQARQLLIARRLVERGVRFVQCWQDCWDTHSNLEGTIRNLAKDSDQALGALLTDLKQRGLLENTLVIWGGEFGRTPTAQGGIEGGGKPDGRDHNSGAFSMWMAGGGVRGGYVHGATDELGFASVRDRVHVHDLHATILRLLGFDHEKFTYRYAGRDFRLTDVYGKIVREILA